MRKGKLVFAQLSEHLSKAVFAQCVSRYAGKYPTLSFSHWDQLLCMMFAQLTTRSSLRDITTCLHSQRAKLYRAGFRGAIARSTLADANEKRDCRIFEDYALHLISIARSLYATDKLNLEFAQTVYAIDATTVDLCLSLFDWAPATKGRAGIKVHTLLDLRGNIPTFIRITGSRVSDVNFLDHLHLEAGSFYVMDRAYVHFARLMRFVHAGAFFVVRSKYNLQCCIVQVDPTNEALGILKDERIVLMGKDTQTPYPVPLRRIEFYDREQDRYMTFLTNHFELQASQIAVLYKHRWQIELFFKWIKQNLRIKAFVGTSANAVKTQIWTAICTYVLVAIIKKRLNISTSMHSVLQALSLTLFETTALDELFSQAAHDELSHNNEHQLSLFGEISGQ